MTPHVIMSQGAAPSKKSVIKIKIYLDIFQLGIRNILYDSNLYEVLFISLDAIV